MERAADLFVAAEGPLLRGRAQLGAPHACVSHVHV